jgi:hypothetical protein
VGKVHPTSKPQQTVTKYWLRCPDPFVAVTAQMREWFGAERWPISRQSLEHLQGEPPGVYPNGQLRMPQRRLRGLWREVRTSYVWGCLLPLTSMFKPDWIALRTVVRTLTHIHKSDVRSCAISRTWV